MCSMFSLKFDRTKASAVIVCLFATSLVTAQESLPVGALIPLTGQFAPLGEDCQCRLITNVKLT